MTVPSQSQRFSTKKEKKETGVDGFQSVGNWFRSWRGIHSLERLRFDFFFTRGIQNESFKLGEANARIWLSCEGETAIFLSNACLEVISCFCVRELLGTLFF